MENSVYENFYLEPLPVGNKILRIRSPHAMRSSRATFIVIKECKCVQRRRLCNPENLFNITGDSCISKLLDGQSANCSFTDYTNHSEVKLVKGSLIVLKQVESLTVNSTCGITNRKLSGTYLIDFHNCSVQLNELEFKNNELIVAEQPVVLPLDGLSITESHFEPILRLEEVDIKNRDLLENFTFSHNIKTYSSITISTLSLVTMIIIALFIARKTIFQKLNTVLREQPLDAQEDIETHHVKKPTRSAAITNRDDSSSKGGVVKHLLDHQLHHIQQQQQHLANALTTLERTITDHTNKCNPHHSFLHQATGHQTTSTKSAD